MAMVDADTIVACLGGPAALVNWLGPKVGSHLALFCVHRMNSVNSCSGSTMMTAP